MVLTKVAAKDALLPLKVSSEPSKLERTYSEPWPDVSMTNVTDDEGIESTPAAPLPGDEVTDRLDAARGQWLVKWAMPIDYTPQRTA